MSTAGDHYFTSSPAAPAQHRPLAVSLAGRQRSLQSASGVFSADRLDAGTAVLLDTVPPPPQRGNLVDLGCGWGPIALEMALASPEADVWAVDVNTRALELTAANAGALGLSRVRAVTPDAVPAGLVVDALWSNPPVRVGKAVLHEMLATWLPRLRRPTRDGEAGDPGVGARPGAVAHLVVHRHLGSDSLARWIAQERFTDDGRAVRADVVRTTSVDGYRVLRVTCHDE